jgi:hypothetical protein
VHAACRVEPRLISRLSWYVPKQRKLGIWAEGLDRRSDSRFFGSLRKGSRLDPRSAPRSEKRIEGPSKSVRCSIHDVYGIQYTVSALNIKTKAYTNTHTDQIATSNQSSPCLSYTTEDSNYILLSSCKIISRPVISETRRISSSFH